MISHYQFFLANNMNLCIRSRLSNILNSNVTNTGICNNIFVFHWKLFIDQPCNYYGKLLIWYLAKTTIEDSYPDAVNDRQLHSRYGELTGANMVAEY